MLLWLDRVSWQTPLIINSAIVVFCTLQKYIFHIGCWLQLGIEPVTRRTAAPLNGRRLSHLHHMVSLWIQFLSEFFKSYIFLWKHIFCLLFSSFILTKITGISVQTCLFLVLVWMLEIVGQIRMEKVDANSNFLSIHCCVNGL